MGLRADSTRPQRVSGSARTDSRRAESARNPIAVHANFGDDSALSAFTRTQWTAAFSLVHFLTKIILKIFPCFLKYNFDPENDLPGRGEHKSALKFIVEGLRPPSTRCARKSRLIA